MFCFVRDNLIGEDLGFAVAPGTHVLLAVHMEQVLSLEDPYGTCIPDAVPRSQCVTACRASKLYEACDCIEPHMVSQQDNGKHQLLAESIYPFIAFYLINLTSFRVMIRHHSRYNLFS